MNMRSEIFELRKSVTIESAHRLPLLPPEHKCARLHGHSFKITLVVRGPLNPQTGWVIDYADLKKAAEPVVAALDHRYLNEVPGLENPTSEVLAQWVYNKIKPSLPLLFTVIIGETCTTECTYPAN